MTGCDSSEFKSFMEGVMADGVDDVVEGTDAADGTDAAGGVDAAADEGSDAAGEGTEGTEVTACEGACVDGTDAEGVEETTGCGVVMGRIGVVPPIHGQV